MNNAFNKLNNNSNNWGFNLLNNNSNKNNIVKFNGTNNIFKNNNIDYKKIGQEFCNIYYKRLNLNLNNIRDFFELNCKFVFLGEECIGINNYLNLLNSKSIQLLNSNIKHIDSTITDNNNLLISVMGVITSNNINYFNFIETFILKKVNNNYLIINKIFRLVE